MDFALPVLSALFLWWFSTGAILFLDGLPRHTHRWSMLAATIMAIASFWGLWSLRSDASSSGAYLGLLCALGVWGWNELAFLTGMITGSWRMACPEQFTGWRRFVCGVEMIIHHEIAIVLGGLAILLVLWGAENQTGLEVYTLLWIMRLSSKLNLFLGIPNAPVSFLPDHLRYMASAFRIRPLNLLFPISITLGTVATIWLGQNALRQGISAFEVSHYSILATLMALAVLEHWFFVLPLPTENLWRWGWSSRVKNTKNETDFVRNIPPYQSPPGKLAGNTLGRAISRPALIKE